MRGRIQNRGHRVGTPAVSGSDGRGHAPCGGGGFGGGVPFGRAAFGSARLPRRLEPRQRGLFIVDHGARRRARPVVVKFAWRNWSSSSSPSRNGPGPEGMRGRTPSMRALAPISATASASRLADAVVDASRRREAAGLHRRCRDERTEVRARAPPPTSPRPADAGEEPTIRLTADISLHPPRRRIASCTASPRASRASPWISTAQRSSSNRGAAPWCARVSSTLTEHSFRRRHRRYPNTRPQTSLTRASITRPNTSGARRAARALRRGSRRRHRRHRRHRPRVAPPAEHQRAAMG